MFYLRGHAVRRTDLTVVVVHIKFQLSREVTFHRDEHTLCHFHGSNEHQKSRNPGELRPKALTQPNVNLSAHQAHIAQSRDELRVATTQTDSFLVEPRGAASEVPWVNSYADVSLAANSGNNIAFRALQDGC